MARVECWPGGLGLAGVWKLGAAAPWLPCLFLNSALPAAAPFCLTPPSPLPCPLRPLRPPLLLLLQVTGGEAMYDQRLFNQDAGGAGAGMGGEDSYNIYDKPLFADRAELFKHTVGGGAEGC